MLGTLRRYAWGVFAVFKHSYTPASENENNRCRVNGEKILRSVDPFIRAPLTTSAFWPELSPSLFVFPKVHIVPLHSVLSAARLLSMVVPTSDPRKRESKRKAVGEQDEADPTDTSDSGNIRKKVRWDGDITEQDEETEETGDYDARSEKV